MKKLDDRRKILLGCLAMVLAMAGDYLLGAGTIGMGTGPESYMGMIWHVVPDWRYALSSILGFASAALFAVAATTLLSVMEGHYVDRTFRFYRMFKAANWGGILYFAFIHIGICMLPVVFNAGMEGTGDMQAAVGMTWRVAKSILVPMAIAFLVCDGFGSIGWMGMVAKGQIPIPKACLLLNPLVIALAGQLVELLPLPFEGMDSGFESLGWLLMYLVSARYLAKE